MAYRHADDPVAHQGGDKERDLEVIARTAPGARGALTAITLKVMSVTIFVAMASLIKAAGPVPAGQIVFYRSFFAIFPILLFLGFQHELRTAFATERPLGHVARGVVGVCSMALSFFALTRLPLPDAITLAYAQPLLVVMFSSIFLGEPVRIYRWSAVTVGLIGVVIISWPELTLLTSGTALSDQEVLGVMAAFGGAGCSAIAAILVRNLVHSEKTATIVLWFSLMASVLSLLSLPFGWHMLTLSQTVLLVSAGFCGGVAQIFMTSAYRHAEVSTVAPFEYTSMILAIAVGYVVFGDVPTLYMLVGGSIVVGAGIFIILRERRLGLERGRARKTTPMQG